MSAIYEREVVKVNVEAVRTVRALVRILKFYKDEQGNPRSDEDKTILLLSLNDALSQIYAVPIPELFVDGSNCCYVAGTPNNVIHLNKPSIISFLHEYRHHLQNVANKMFTGLSVEEDARAWSMRCFSKASPGNFINSVKAGRILFLKWDEENGCVVDDLEAIELNDTGSAESRLRAALASFAPAENAELGIRNDAFDLVSRVAALVEEPESLDSLRSFMLSPDANETISLQHEDEEEEVW